MAAIVFLRTWIRGARTLKSTFENPVEDERKTMRPLFLYLGFTKSCPVWEKFLSDFTAGSEIRKMGLQSWFKCLIHGHINAQVFLFIVGQAFTGKSVFAHLRICFVAAEPL